ncbi:MAG: CDP-glucose 4,6-dehydratase [Mucilaginibacter sp.]
MPFEDIYKNKKILITGHTGFKGSWLSIWLKMLGAEVYGYALPPYSDMDNFSTCGLAGELNHKEGNVKNLEDLKAYFAEVNPDMAFHLAAQPLVLLSYRNPVNTFETNLLGVVNFFEAVRATPSVKVAINITSDKCYDNKEWAWGYRENDPMGGKDPYSASKGCAELITDSYLNSFFKGSECNIASARAGNVIGGGDWATDRIVPDYFRSIKNKSKLIIRNPDATRPWQHVLEPLSGYLNLGYFLYKHGERYSGGWNFGPKDSSNHSVKTLIDKIISLDGRGQYEIPADHCKFHEANFLKLDISKAVNYLHWNPVLDFDETADFTLIGYEDDFSAHDLFQKRKIQINEYTQKAFSKGILWAQ